MLYLELVCSNLVSKHFLLFVSMDLVALLMHLQRNNASHVGFLGSYYIWCDTHKAFFSVLFSFVFHDSTLLNFCMLRGALSEVVSIVGKYLVFRQWPSSVLYSDCGCQCI